MKTGILVPLPQELLSLTNIRMIQGSCTALTDHLIICLTGIGRDQTGLGFEHLIRHGAQWLISWGSAAGLFPGLNAGDLLIPESIRIEHREFETSNPYNQRIISGLPHSITLHRGPMVETRKILATVEDKKQLFAISGCKAADMESGALAQLATENNIPFSVVRAVSDPVDLVLPGSLLGSFVHGTFQPLTLMSRAITKPDDWVAIAKLMSGFKKAKKTLRVVGELIKTHSDKWT